MRGKPRLTFLTEVEARPEPGDLVFRERRLGKLLASLVFFALTGGLVGAAWLAASEDGVGAALAAFLMLIASPCLPCS